jgi:hypothetical protein
MASLAAAVVTSSHWRANAHAFYESLEVRRHGCGFVFDALNMSTR